MNMKNEEVFVFTAIYKWRLAVFRKIKNAPAIAERFH